MAKQIVLTRAGLEKLENELADLKSVKRKEVAEKIKIALSFGDLSENSEYDEAKNEQAIVEARIADIEVMLKNVTVIAPAGSTAAQYASSHNFPYEETRFRDVMDQIAALGSVTTEDQSRVEAARAAYNALSSLQKSLVTNADRLTHAEEMLHLLLNGIGDLDGNGFFGLVDVVLLRQGILAEEWNPSGDLNQDQRMSVSDVVLLRNIILSQV